MVNLWPWRGEDTSPASFERALSTLSDKISKSQIQLDSLRQQSRRAKALWTLYTSFAYILCLIILALVVGWQNWAALEYTAISGSPVVIYIIRTAITTFYQYRIDKVTARLDSQQTERTKTIEKLKAATKYNSTQQLLEKYGGAPPSAPSPSSNRKPKGPGASPSTPRSTGKLPQRTTIGPPATANIPGRTLTPQQQPSTPQAQQVDPLASLAQSPIAPRTPQPETAEFAPNAFSGALQYSQGESLATEGHWYDRVLDLLLGEDETLPKNRLALICQHCRLINGQAPPGVNRLQDVGKWRCGGCGGWNGEIDEGTKLVQEMTEKAQMETKDQPGRSSEDELVDLEEIGDEEGTDNGDDVEEDSVLVETPVPRKRGRPKGSGKKK